MSDVPESAGLPAPPQPATDQRMVERPSIDRTALERVLARAAQLQMAAGEDTGPADGLSESQLLDVGREVGLSPAHLRQALAEERTRVTEDPIGRFDVSRLYAKLQRWPFASPQLSCPPSRVPTQSMDKFA